MSTIHDKLPLEDNAKLIEELREFNWEFSLGDNILYNLQVLRTLYHGRETLPAGHLLNKPISIQMVSIIEAILIDFLSRLDQGTKHLPTGIDENKILQMKEEIKKSKITVKVDDEMLEQYIFLKRKMYGFAEIVKILRKYELFGNSDDDFYAQLSNFGDIRNRVHIENYHNNLEEKENRVFTSRRISELEEVLCNLWNKMKTDYKRPWKRS